MKGFEQHPGPGSVSCRLFGEPCNGTAKGFVLGKITYTDSCLLKDVYSMVSACL